MAAVREVGNGRDTIDGQRRGANVEAGSGGQRRHSAAAGNEQ
jgi:hypothetical protein